MVSGEPAPKVTWERNKGTMDDSAKYKARYDARNKEHVLEVRNTVHSILPVAFMFLQVSCKYQTTLVFRYMFTKINAVQEVSREIYCFCSVCDYMLFNKKKSY